MSGTPPAPDAAAPVHVAVVDDDPRIVETMAVYLRGLDCMVRTFTDAIACRDALAAAPADILVTDLDMPGLNGLQLMGQVKATHPATEVIVVTGNADKASAIGALKAGAYDFFEKPVDRDELTATVTRTMRYQQAVADRDRMAEQLAVVSQREAARWGLDAFVGQSAAIGEVVRSIRLVQNAPKTAILVTGESGTGKELVARAIHFGGRRSRGPFIPVNCSALPAELAESVLFGHVRGAFTGAMADQKGCFEAADGGTVFLDEIGDMPMAIQAKLLRVLEDGVVTPVGKHTGRRVDVRVVAATNASLTQKMEADAFRSDLFFRLAGYSVHVPPLRERADDIALLADHFAGLLAAEMGMPPPALAPAAVDALRGYAFPGNVRELKNMIERALIESGGQTITPRHLHFLPLAKAGGSSPAVATVGDASALGLPLNLAQAEQAVMKRALAQTDGNVSAAARLLGINRTKLYRMMALEVRRSPL